MDEAGISFVYSFVSIFLLTNDKIRNTLEIRQAFENLKFFVLSISQSSFTFSTTLQKM